jgi:hypothetical protein
MNIFVCGRVTIATRFQVLLFSIQCRQVVIIVLTIEVALL